jgi:hypothetical protein
MCNDCGPRPLIQAANHHPCYVIAICVKDGEQTHVCTSSKILVMTWQGGA